MKWQIYGTVYNIPEGIFRKLEIVNADSFDDAMKQARNNHSNDHTIVSGAEPIDAE